MFDLVYHCQFQTFKKVNDGVRIRTHIYTFKANNKQRYVVEFDEFEGHILLVKFYQKNHSQSDHKYNIMTGDGWCSSIIFTVFSLMLKIWRDNAFGHVSFAFMGSNTYYNDGSKESKKETKRFKFYKMLIANFIGPDNFEFKQNVESSIFVLLNKRNPTVGNSLESVLKYVYENYSILDVDLILEPLKISGQSG